MINESQLLYATDSAVQCVLPAAAQVVHLDFDGAQTSYRNTALDIALEDVRVEDSGISRESALQIASSLNQLFGDDVLFTIDVPAAGPYSTIYIGKTDVFDAYGDFLGLAETIDSGNQIRNDNAFVLLDSTVSDDIVTSVIAHEANHIVKGMDHGGQGLERYAASTSTTLRGTGRLNVYRYGEASNTVVRGIDTNGSNCYFNIYDNGVAYRWRGPRHHVVREWQDLRLRVWPDPGHHSELRRQPRNPKQRYH